MNETVGTNNAPDGVSVFGKAGQGGVIRKEVAVYLSGSERDTTAADDIDIKVRGVESTVLGPSS